MREQQEWGEGNGWEGEGRSKGSGGADMSLRGKVTMRAKEAGGKAEETASSE